eukprot:282407_1
MTYGKLTDYPIEIEQSSACAGAQFKRAKTQIKPLDRFTVVCPNQACDQGFEKRNRYNQWRRSHNNSNKCGDKQVVPTVTSWLSVRRINNPKYRPPPEPVDDDEANNPPMQSPNPKKKKEYEYEFLDEYEMEYRLVQLDDVTKLMKPLQVNANNDVAMNETDEDEDLNVEIAQNSLRERNEMNENNQNRVPEDMNVDFEPAGQHIRRNELNRIDRSRRRRASQLEQDENDQIEDSNDHHIHILRTETVIETLCSFLKLVFSDKRKNMLQPNLFKNTVCYVSMKQRNSEERTCITDTVNREYYEQYKRHGVITDEYTLSKRKYEDSKVIHKLDTITETSIFKVPLTDTKQTKLLND